MGNSSASVLVSLLLNTLLCCGQAPDSVLTIEPKWSTLYFGQLVTFICHMNEGRDNDWFYQLRKNGEELFSFRQDKHFRVQSLPLGYSGEYRCCGLWKWSSSFTKCSKTVTVSVSDNPKASLTAGSTSIPVGGNVTLSCLVDPSAGWKYRWFRRTKNTPEVELTDKENRDINVTQGGIYRCYGQRENPSFYSHSSNEKTIKIMFSNQVLVTQQPNWRHIFSGESITLTCEIQGGETTEWTCEWMRNRSVIHRTESKHWTLIVSESSSGDYACQCRRRDDLISSTRRSETITVTVSSPVSSSFPVMLIVGPVSGIILIILLLLLCLCRRSKDLCCFRLFQSESSSQSPATNPGENQTESHYSSLLHGTTSVYETIHNQRATGNERPRDPEDGSVYVNVRPDNYSSA